MDLQGVVIWGRLTLTGQAFRLVETPELRASNTLRQSFWGSFSGTRGFGERFDGWQDAVFLSQIRILVDPNDMKNKLE